MGHSSITTVFLKAYRSKSERDECDITGVQGMETESRGSGIDVDIGYKILNGSNDLFEDESFC